MNYRFFDNAQTFGGKLDQKWGLHTNSTEIHDHSSLNSKVIELRVWKSSMFLSLAPHLCPWLTCLNPLYMVQISCLVNFVEVMRSLSWTVFLFLCASLWVTASWRSNPSSMEWVSARSKICSLLLWLKLFVIHFVCAHEQCYFGIMRRGPYLQGVTPGRNDCPKPLQERKQHTPFHLDKDFLPCPVSSPLTSNALAVTFL